IRAEPIVDGKPISVAKIKNAPKISSVSNSSTTPFASRYFKTFLMSESVRSALINLSSLRKLFMLSGVTFSLRLAFSGFTKQLQVLMRLFQKLNSFAQHSFGTDLWRIYCSNWSSALTCILRKNFMHRIRRVVVHVKRLFNSVGLLFNDSHGPQIQFHYVDHNSLRSGVKVLMFTTSAKYCVQVSASLIQPSCSTFLIS